MPDASQLGGAIALVAFPAAAPIKTHRSHLAIAMT
jgi:hypothetical protein